MSDKNEAPKSQSMFQIFTRVARNFIVHQSKLGGTTGVDPMRAALY